MSSTTRKQCRIDQQFNDAVEDIQKRGRYPSASSVFNLLVGEALDARAAKAPTPKTKCRKR